MPCPGSNDCMPLRECPQILVEVTKRCYNSDRSLFCGVNQNYEPYVCCPSYQSPSYVGQAPTYIADGTNQFTSPDKLSGQCGKSLIQGNFYKKLGAFPFVARIGFKSKLCFAKIGKIHFKSHHRMLIGSRTAIRYLLFFVLQCVDN